MTVLYVRLKYVKHVELLQNFNIKTNKGRKEVKERVNQRWTVNERKGNVKLKKWNRC